MPPSPERAFRALEMTGSTHVAAVGGYSSSTSIAADPLTEHLTRFSPGRQGVGELEELEMVISARESPARR